MYQNIAPVLQEISKQYENIEDTDETFCNPIQNSSDDHEILHEPSTSKESIIIFQNSEKEISVTLKPAVWTLNKHNERHIFF